MTDIGHDTAEIAPVADQNVTLGSDRAQDAAGADNGERGSGPAAAAGNGGERSPARDHRQGRQDGGERRDSAAGAPTSGGPGPEGGQRDATEDREVPGDPGFSERDGTVRGTRRTGVQKLSDHSRGVQYAYGPTALGDNSVVAGVINISAAAAQRATLRRGPFERRRLDERRAHFVETSSYGKLLERLGGQRRVQVLQGAAGSGRTTTAVLALAALLAGGGPCAGLGHPGPDGEGELVPCGGRVEVLGAETKPGTLEADDLTTGHGYLLDRTSAGSGEQLDFGILSALDRLLADHDALLIIVVDDRMPLDLDSLEDYLIRQAPPAPEAVLDAHLGQDVRGSWTHEVRQEVHDELRFQPAPGRVVELAAYLREAHRAELTGPGIMAWFRQRLQAKTRAKLANPFDGATEPRTRAESLSRQAHLIATAALNELPLVAVSSAAVELAELLYDVQSAGRPLGRRVFGDTVDELLHYMEATDQEPLNGSTARDGARRTSMRAGLPAIVLEVAWRDYDVLRVPLLRWLQGLVDVGTAAVRVRAALAVGKLATFDFPFVFREVIQPWASSAGRGNRLAAAWALEMAATEESIDTHVRGELLRWTRGQARYRQRTALLTWGTGIGARHFDLALESLEHLAPRPELAEEWDLSLTVRELYLAGPSPDRILAAIEGWAEQGRQDRLPPLSVQAARGFIAMSERNGDPGGPDLLKRFASDEVWRSAVTRLWRLALTEPATSENGWRALERWLARTKARPSLVDALVALVTTLVDDAGLRDRARFRRRWWLARNPAGGPVDEIWERALGMAEVGR